MPERLKAILDKITAWWKKFNTKQRSVLISIVAVVIVALVILGVVISRPTQVELVEAQSASEASTIKGVLEDNNISYEVDSKLVFFVNKSDEVNAIMALGDNGIPAQAYSIDNVTDGSFSTTEADKQKKYQVYRRIFFHDSPFYSLTKTASENLMYFKDCVWRNISLAFFVVCAINRWHIAQGSIKFLHKMIIHGTYVCFSDNR